MGFVPPPLDQEEFRRWLACRRTERLWRVLCMGFITGFAMASMGAMAAWSALR